MDEIRKAAQQIGAAIERSSDEPELKALASAGVTLLTLFLLDVRRIADALEAIAAKAPQA